MCGRIGNACVKGVFIIEGYGDTEDIALVENGIGVGVEWNILEEATRTRTKLIHKVDGLEETCDARILGVWLQIVKGYIPVPLGTAGVLHIHPIPHNDEFRDVVAGKLAMNEGVGEHFPGDDCR